MKKIWKAVLAVLATVAMALTGFAGAISAYAADNTYTITIDQADAGHTYEAYQVFTGDLAENDTLSNIKWGAGVNSSNLLKALKADQTFGTTFANAESAADVASLLIADNAVKFAKIAVQNLSAAATGTSGTYDQGAKSYTISGLAAGYYLVKDKDNTLDNAEAAYTEYILKVVQNTTVSPKGTVPTVEKKVKDTGDSTGKTTGWQDSADYDVNDTIPYQLTGTLSDKYADYAAYAYKFTDTLSKGLTLDQNSIKVYAVNGEGDARTKVEIKKDNATGYKVLTTNYAGTDDKDPYKGGTVLTVEFADLKKATPTNNTDTLTIDANTKIVVEYEATLNSNAIIGSAGNPNKVDLTFANNPYGEGAGKTPEDKVTVFTFKIVANKVDGQNHALKGAGFTLYKWNGKEYKTVGNEIKGDKLTTFSFDRLDAGQYKLAETTTPAGYNTWAGLEFKVIAEHQKTSNDPQLTTLKVTDLSDKEISGAGKTFTIDMTAGSATMNVTNEKGSTLPSTGGMGTVVLYVAGAALVLAAGLWFGLRRRNRSR